MSNKINIVIKAFVKFFFKWKDNEHTIDNPFDLVYTRLFPGPYLRGDIIKNPDTFGFCKLGNAQVKSRIID